MGNVGAFIRDAPVGLHEDALVRINPDLERKLTLIADEIVAGGGLMSPAAVYCVSGPWGAGKSSILAILRDLVEERAGGVAVAFSTFRAPVHATTDSSVRLGLLTDLLLGLPDDALQGIASSLGYPSESAEIGIARELSPRASVYQRVCDLAQTNMSIETVIAAELARQLTRGATSVSPARSVYVVFVEDLDRTDLDYTAKLLEALTFWREASGVSFVVACDRHHLEQASASLPQPDGASSEKALSKHVHITLDVPTLFETDDDVAEFALARLRGIGRDESECAIVRLLSGTKSDRKIFRPLLSRRRPREIVELLNRLLGEFSIVLRGADLESMKRVVATAAWPDDFRRLAGHATMQRGGLATHSLEEASAVVRLRALLQLAARALAEGAAGSPEDSLVTMARDAGIDVAGWPLEMLLYLADDPPISLDESGLDVAGLGAALNAGESWDGTASRLSPTDKSQLPELVASDDVQLATPTELDRIFSEPSQADADSSSVGVELVRLWMQIDSISRAGGEFSELFQEVVELLQDEESLSDADSPTIGNLALVANRVDSRLSWELHKLAHELDPEHLNIRINIADFLLDEAATNEAAASLALDHVRFCLATDSEFKNAHVKHLEFRALAALDKLTGRDRGEFAERMQFVLDSEEDAFWIELVQALVPVSGWEDAVDQVIQSVISSRPEYTYRAMRGWADTLLEATARRGVELIPLALDVLRFVCATSGLPFDPRLTTEAERRVGPEQLQIDCAHNLALAYWTASLTDVGDSDVLLEASAQIWRLVYEGSQSERIRTGYSRMLAEALGESESAERVLNGQAVEIPLPSEANLRSIAERIPTYFEPDADRWWEGIDVSPEAEVANHASILGPFAIPRLEE